jgi:hypothetical protein
MFFSLNIHKIEIPFPINHYNLVKKIFSYDSFNITTVLLMPLHEHRRVYYENREQWTKIRRALVAGTTV